MSGGGGRLRVALATASRRDVLLSGASGILLLGSLGLLRTAAATGVPVVPGAWREAFDLAVGSGTPVESKRIKVDVPDIAENGNVVPIAVSVESPMSETDRILSVHLFSTGNHIPRIVTFHFSKLSGLAAASTRMRLLSSQEVVILGQSSGGEMLVARREVKVTIGGCGG